MNLPEKDIHNHLLPGVDDGFRNAGDSVEAIRQMAEAGCTDITFTPHMNPDVYPDSSEDLMRKVYEQFLPHIPQDLGVTTHLAAEYMIVNGFENRDPDTLLTYPDGSILIEMSYYFRSPNLETAVFNLNMAGLKPILAHPERYLYLANKLGTFEKLKDMGCRFQMNLRSLSGCYGPESLKILKHIEEQGWYDFRATDLHSLEQLEAIKKQDDPEAVRKKKSIFSLFRH